MESVVKPVAHVSLESRLLIWAGELHLGIYQYVDLMRSSEIVYMVRIGSLRAFQLMEVRKKAAKETERGPLVERRREVGER